MPIWFGMVFLWSYVLKTSCQSQMDEFLAPSWWSSTFSSQKRPVFKCSVTQQCRHSFQKVITKYKGTYSIFLQMYLDKRGTIPPERGRSNSKLGGVKCPLLLIIGLPRSENRFIYDFAHASLKTSTNLLWSSVGIDWKFDVSVDIKQKMSWIQSTFHNVNSTSNFLISKLRNVLLKCKRK